MDAGSPSSGLTSAEAARRLQQYGPNAAPEERSHPLLALLSKFWAPVPWMLEATILLEMLMGRRMEAVIIGLLLLFNAVLSFLQENRAQNALALLRQRLAVQARVLRDRQWKLMPAQELVPGDVIHMRMGDMAPSDMRIVSGQILLDQSALSGESVPVEAGANQPAYAGTVVKRGEATGEVTATGTRTTFGKTAELVRLAKTASHLERVIFGIVRYLVVLDALLVAVVLIYALATGIALREILPFALILLVASIPVALVTFFGVTYVVPAVERWPGTIFAVNVGGALIPAILSCYLLVRNRLFELGLLSVAVVAAVVHGLARPVPGVGISVPILIPPLIAAAAAMVLSRRNAPPLAYIAGSLGTLIGADLLNLNHIQGLGAPIASIGGAGTFDGVFLTGILAVLLPPVRSDTSVPAAGAGKGTGADRNTPLFR